MNRTKILGAYLLVAGIFQAGLYLAMSLPGDHLWLMYFDPRLALFFVEVTLKGPDLVAPWVFSWLSAVWLILLGGLMVFGHSWIKTYIVSEILLSLPNVSFGNRRLFGEHESRAWVFSRRIVIAGSGYGAVHHCPINVDVLVPQRII